MALLGPPTRLEIAGEGPERAALESLACGVPVVVSGLGGLPELVEPGRDGEIVAAGDAAAMAGALAAMLADPGRALAMGAAGRAKVERRFAPAPHLRRLERIYRGGAG